MMTAAEEGGGGKSSSTPKACARMAFLTCSACPRTHFPRLDAGGDGVRPL